MTEHYSEESIKTLGWKEHIRRRPEMYIGKLGDGSSADDGIYILIKEVIDNSIDEFAMRHGKVIDVTTGTMTLEVVGSQKKIDSFIELMENIVNIREIVRSGVVALLAGKDSISL